MADREPYHWLADVQRYPWGGGEARYLRDLAAARGRRAAPCVPGRAALGSAAEPRVRQGTQHVVYETTRCVLGHATLLIAGGCHVPTLALWLDRAVIEATARCVRDGAALMSAAGLRARQGTQRAVSLTMQERHFLAGLRV